MSKFKIYRPSHQAPYSRATGAPRIDGVGGQKDQTPQLLPCGCCIRPETITPEHILEYSIKHKVPLSYLTWEMVSGEPPEKKVTHRINELSIAPKL